MAKFRSSLGRIANFSDNAFFLWAIFLLCNQSFTGKNSILREFVFILFSKSQFTSDPSAKDVLASSLQKGDENQKF